MKYAKLIEGWPVFAPRMVKYNGYKIYNPPEEILIALGYKPVQFTEPPEVPEGYFLVESWTETEDKIIQVFNVLPIPEEE